MLIITGLITIFSIFFYHTANNVEKNLFLYAFSIIVMIDDLFIISLFIRKLLNVFIHIFFYIDKDLCQLYDFM